AARDALQDSLLVTRGRYRSAGDLGALRVVDVLAVTFDFPRRRYEHVGCHELRRRTAERAAVAAGRRYRFARWKLEQTEPGRSRIRRGRIGWWWARIHVRHTGVRRSA